VKTRSEEDEGLLDVTFNALHLLSDHVELHGLGEGTALSDGNDITDLEAESGGAVSGDGLMALLEPVVLAHVVEVVTTDDDVSVHFGRDHNTLEDFATDADISGEGALVVNELFFDGGLGGLEAKANFFVESNTFRSFGSLQFFGVEELANLLLEGSFSLVISHLRSSSKSRFLQQINNNTLLFKLLNTRTPPFTCLYSLRS